MRTGIAAVHVHEALRPATPSDPRIVSSAHGAIRQILLCYPPYAGGEYSLESTYAELLRVLPASCEITVLVHPLVSDDFARIVERERPQSRPLVVEAPEYLLFSVWAEDGYVSVRDTGDQQPVTFLVEPFTFPRYGDGMIAELVAEATDVQATQVPLYFQGGNVLAGDDFVLVGVDYLTMTLDTWRRYDPVLVGSGTPSRRAQELFGTTFGRPHEV